MLNIKITNFFTNLSAKNVVHKSKVVINFKIIEWADFFP
jgi:hypothetical protein